MQLQLLMYTLGCLVFDFLGGNNLNYEKRIHRINYLALKAREFKLTEEEIRERDILRREYAADTLKFVEEENEKSITLVKQ